MGEVDVFKQRVRVVANRPSLQETMKDLINKENGS